MGDEIGKGIESLIYIAAFLALSTVSLLIYVALAALM